MHGCDLVCDCVEMRETNKLFGLKSISKERIKIYTRNANYVATVVCQHFLF